MQAWVKIAFKTLGNKEAHRFTDLGILQMTCPSVTRMTNRGKEGGQWMEGWKIKDKRRNRTDTLHEQDQYTVWQTRKTSPHQPTLTLNEATHTVQLAAEPSKRIPPREELHGNWDLCSVSFLTTVSRTARL